MAAVQEVGRPQYRVYAPEQERDTLQCKRGARLTIGCTPKCRDTLQCTMSYNVLKTSYRKCGVFETKLFWSNQRVSFFTLAERRVHPTYPRRGPFSSNGELTEDRRSLLTVFASIFEPHLRCTHVLTRGAHMRYHKTKNSLTRETI